MAPTHDDDTVRSYDERKIEMLTRIAKTLDMPVADLVVHSPDGVPALGHVMQLIELWHRIRDDADRQYLLSEARRLADPRKASKPLPDGR